MGVGRTDSKFDQIVSKKFMKGGDEKIVSNVYPFDWVNAKGEQRKGKIMIKNGIFMAIMFIETRETTETTLLHF